MAARALGFGPPRPSFSQTSASAAFWGRIDLVLLFLALALVVLWKHRDNIDRLLSGTEPRIGKKRD